MASIDSTGQTITGTFESFRPERPTDAGDLCTHFLVASWTPTLAIKGHPLPPPEHRPWSGPIRCRPTTAIHLRVEWTNERSASNPTKGRESESNVSVGLAWSADERCDLTCRNGMNPL